ncbi:hypothetical protein [Paenibacillus naphthalenovorans]|uniref:hypothetical protein n=1 Tax=Paenibacillus naphthalenovorans TaxID=162209 RepID=UPI003D2CBB6D
MDEVIGHTLDCGVLPLECMCGLWVFFGATDRRGDAPEASLDSSCSGKVSSLPRQHRKIKGKVNHNNKTHKPKSKTKNQLPW